MTKTIKYGFLMLLAMFLVGCVTPQPTPEPHEHEFVDGECECGEIDPDYEEPEIHYNILFNN